MTDLLRYNVNLINGEWVPADSGKTIDVFNPADGSLVGQVPNSGAAETRRAIDAAAAAFETFKTTLAAERADMLFALYEAIRTNTDELAFILTSEQGKPLGEAKGELNLSAAYIRWFAEEARRVYGDIVPSPFKNRKLLVTREPAGVCAAITPWNFPSSMLSRKVGPAIAAGCTVVIKPASQTPYSGLAWGALAEMAGLPKGVVNVVTGSAREIGGELTANPKVRKVTFTGSTEVGKTLIAQSAATVKRSRWNWAAMLPSSSLTTPISKRPSMRRCFQNIAMPARPVSAPIASLSKTASTTPSLKGSPNAQRL